MPQRDRALAHLTLADLRTYRRQLGAKESLVSYWRRVVQARLDIVRVGDSAWFPPSFTPSLDPIRLRDGWCDGWVSRHPAFLAGPPADDLPSLPDLARLWARNPKPGDAAHNAALAAELAEAESQLSAYRAALHARLEAATADLIARYREEPRLALTALPLDPPIPPRRLPGRAMGPRAVGYE